MKLSQQQILVTLALVVMVLVISLSHMLSVLNNPPPDGSNPTPSAFLYIFFYNENVTSKILYTVYAVIALFAVYMVYFSNNLILQGGAIVIFGLWAALMVFDTVNAKSGTTIAIGSGLATLAGLYWYYIYNGRVGY